MKINGLRRQFKLKIISVKMLTSPHARDETWDHEMLNRWKQIILFLSCHFAQVGFEPFSGKKRVVVR